MENALDHVKRNILRVPMLMLLSDPEKLIIPQCAVKKLLPRYFFNPVAVHAFKPLM